MMRFIVLFILVISLSFGASSVYRQGDYVFDTKNHLLWQDTPENTTILKSQADAKKYCEDLVLGKFSSWRLPNRDEYRTIIDMNRKADELTIHRAFKHVLSDHYWTQDRTWRNFFRWGYYVYFKSGTFYYENKTYPKYVRCVHDY